MENTCIFSEEYIHPKKHTYGKNTKIPQTEKNGRYSESYNTTHDKNGKNTQAEKIFIFWKYKIWQYCIWNICKIGKSLWLIKNTEIIPKHLMEMSQIPGKQPSHFRKDQHFGKKIIQWSTKSETFGQVEKVSRATVSHRSRNGMGVFHDAITWLWSLQTDIHFSNKPCWKQLSQANTATVWLNWAMCMLRCSQCGMPARDASLSFSWNDCSLHAWRQEWFSSHKHLKNSKACIFQNSNYGIQPNHFQSCIQWVTVIQYI